MFLIIILYLCALLWLFSGLFGFLSLFVRQVVLARSIEVFLLQLRYLRYHYDQSDHVWSHDSCQESVGNHVHHGQSSPDAAMIMNRGYIYLQILENFSPNKYSACFQPNIQHAIRVENTNRNTEIATK